MDVRAFVLGLIGLAASADAFKSLPKSIAQEAMHLLNHYRMFARASDMQTLHYDYEAQAKLDAIIASHPKHWMFENYTGPIPSYGIIRQNLNGYYLAEQIGYPPGFQIGWHDTCKKVGANCLPINLQFRASQKDCFDYNRCNTTAYDRFKSCATDALETQPHKTCSFVFNYWPMFLRSDATRFACAVLGDRGWRPPPGQKESYWCYTDGTTPKDDRPYQKEKYKLTL